jgi:non-specific protein-tyrosine kinase
MHDLGLREYLHVLRRRKWIVLQALIIVPLVAVAFALRQSPLYQASADVLLRYQSLPSALSGITDPNSALYFTDPVRSTATQLRIASMPALADRVATALHGQHVTFGEVAGSTSVSAVSGADVLTFQATSSSPALAVLIANAYARQYTLYRQSLDTGSITKAASDLKRRIDQLKAQGGARSEVSQLQSKVDQLETLLSLETSNAIVVRIATGATKIRPRPIRYGVLGLGLGLVLGIGLAFLRDAFDTRLRTTDQIGEILGLPLLARIPEPPRRLRSGKGLLMLNDPLGSAAEPFRILATNLDFVNLERNARTIMFTSATHGEGKSTTVANLAVALARGGRRVILVDLDMRKPSLDGLFALHERPGVTTVVLGQVSLSDVLVPIPLLDPGAAADGATDGSARGMVEVLPVGPLPPKPAEFVGSRALAALLAELEQRADLVLIDAPPILDLSDAMTLSAQVDGLVVVTRLPSNKRSTLMELHRVLATAPTTKLGVVLTGTTASDTYGSYGYGYGAGDGSRATWETTV